MILVVNVFDGNFLIGKCLGDKRGEKEEKVPHVSHVCSSHTSPGGDQSHFRSPGALKPC
jgi:hypothetical protein